MNRHWGATLVIALLLAGTACASDSSPKVPTSTTVQTTTSATIPTVMLTARASQVTDSLIANKWADVTAAFNGALQARFDASSLKTAWGSITATYGAYKSRGPTVASGLAFETPMLFGTTRMKSRITFDSEGRVSDLLIVKA